MCGHFYGVEKGVLVTNALLASLMTEAISKNVVTRTAMNLSHKVAYENQDNVSRNVSVCISQLDPAST